MFLTGDQIFASLGFATILVVAVAVLGSLTVLPALLSRLGDNVDRLRVPFVGRRRGRRRRAVLGRDRRPRAAPPGPVGGARGRRCCWRSPLPALQLRLAPQGAESFPQSLDGDQDLPPDAAGVPRHGAAGRTSSSRRASVRTPAARSAIARARAAGARQRPRVRADHGRRQPGRHGREHHRADRRERHRRRLERRASRPARRRSCPRRSARFRTPRPA